MQTIEDLAKWLRERDDIAIVTHVHPDGDALGTSNALRLALEQMGKRAICVCDDPVPDNLKFLPLISTQKEDLPFAPKCALLCDAGEASRAGLSSEVLENAAEKATLDHHGTSEGVGDVRIVRPDAAATGVPALELIRALGITLTADMANCLYAAISTDTGNFAFRNTNAQAFRAAAECVQAGADVDTLNFCLFRSRRIQKTRLIGEAVHEMEFLFDGRLAVITITQDMLRRAGAEAQDVESIVDYGINTQGVEVAMLLHERQDSAKASLRSRGDTDVAKLCQSLGGGGHRNAAGATIKMPVNEAKAFMIDLIQKTYFQG